MIWLFTEYIIARKTLQGYTNLFSPNSFKTMTKQNKKKIEKEENMIRNEKHGITLLLAKSKLNNNKSLKF